LGRGGGRTHFWTGIGIKRVSGPSFLFIGPLPSGRLHWLHTHSLRLFTQRKYSINIGICDLFSLAVYIYRNNICKMKGIIFVLC
jgi:hypothetical protein